MIKELISNTEGITALAVFFLLVSTMIDPRIAGGFAFIFLIMNWLISLRRWIWI